MNLSFSIPKLFLAAGLLVAFASSSPAVAPAMTALPESIKPVQQAVDQGAVNPRQPFISRRNLKQEETSAPLGIELALKMRNFAELQARVAKGERISAQEMASRYEPLASDYQTLASWANQQGLSITRQDKHHLALFVKAPVAQIQQAMNVKFARVTFANKEYTSAISAPHVPTALTSILLGINGLQPHLRPHKHLIKQDQKNGLSGNNSYTPYQIGQAYDAGPLYTSNISGSGQTIALVIDTFPSTSDLISFWQQEGISQSISNIQFIQAVPGQLAQPSGEETLDVEWSSAIAPSAHVRVYAATDLEDNDLDQTYAQVYDDVSQHPELNIHQMSMSYGEGETYTSYSQVETDSQYFAELAAAGVTIFASSGDNGSTPGASGDSNGPLQPESPASDPNVSGVGGTTLILNESTTVNVTSETVWNDSEGASGGGTSMYFSRPSWQTGSGVTGSMRHVPDIACSADPAHGAYVVLNGELSVYGGTSWASPTCAGFMALANEARANAGLSSVGLLGPHIYPLIGSSSLRDIVSGNNATSRSGGDYSAGAGYDLCTGVGSMLLQPLAQQLVGSSTLVGLQLSSTVQTVTPGQSATFTVSGGGNSATYQWQRMPIGQSSWSNLTDGTNYSGSATASLMILGTTTAMSGDQFRCNVTASGGGTTTTGSAVLIVETPLSISTLAGQTGNAGYANGTGTAARFNYPSAIAVDTSGNLFVADYSNNQIREVTPGGVVSTPFGSLSQSAGSNNGTGNSALFNTPNAIAADGSNNLYVADTGNNLIRKITGNTVSTLAGAGNSPFNGPEGIAVDSSGNVYVADTGNDVIRKVAPSGAVSILAGRNGVAGFADGAAAQALFNQPSSVAVDSLGNVYVADFNNSVVRKISAGVVTTVAGQAGQSGYQDGLGTTALFNAPLGLAVDMANNLYITDALVPPTNSTASGNNLLRKLTPSGVVSTLAGEAGVSGSANGTGSNAQFYSIQGVAISNSGELYLADTYNQTIRASGLPSNGVISLSGTLAFGGLIVGTTATEAITINNTGVAPLTVSGITYPSGFSGDWASGTIPPGSSQTVNVTFAPRSVTAYGGNIIINSNASSGTNIIAASGSGLPAPVAPLVSTGSYSSVSASSATLNGTVDPKGSATTAYFDYGTTTNYGNVTGSSTVGSGTLSEPFLQIVTGLNSQTVYHYRSVASSVGGTVYGADRSFTTMNAPLIGSNPMAYVGAADVQLQQSVNPNGVSTMVYFQYGTSTSYTNQTGTQSIGTGRVAVNVSGLLPELTANTTYHYRIVTSSAAGTFYGPDETFSTLPFSTSPIAETGDSADGVAGAEYSTLGNPIINGIDNVAFAANLMSGLGGVTTSSNAGIWAMDGTGTLQLLARTGTLAPGTSTNFFVLNDPVYNKNNAVAFTGTLALLSGQVTSANNVGLWSSSSGSLSLLARVGEAAPGYAAGATFQSFNAFALPDQNGVALLATLNLSRTAGVTAANQKGIWMGNSTSDLHLVVREGNTYNGKTITALSFLPSLSYVGGQTRSFVQADGDLVYLATFSDRTTGLFGISGGTTLPIALSATAAPGVPNGTYLSFGNPAINASDDAAFAATLTSGLGGVTSSNNQGIWADDTTNTLQLIARTGETAAGTSASFYSLSDPVYNDGEAVAFRGVLRIVSGQATSANNSGLWSNVGGSLALVVRQGAQAPGCPVGASFYSFNAFSLPDQGGVIFSATLNSNTAAGVTSTNNQGVWAVDTNGDLQLIVRTGDILNGKTVSTLSFLPSLPTVGGQTRSFNQTTGDLVYRVTFTDKTNGIYEVVFP